MALVLVLALRSVQRQILPNPFIHAFVRSTPHRLPTYTGAGTPVRAISASKPNPSSRARVGPLS